MVARAGSFPCGVRRFSPNPSLIGALTVFSIWLGCGERTSTSATDFSKSNMVSIGLGIREQEYGTGLQHMYFESDGLTITTTLDGEPCRYLKLEGVDIGYLYFALDPTFKTKGSKNFTINVEYFDQPEGVVNLEFDASEPNKAWKAYFLANEVVHFAGTRTWRTATFHVQDATFKNRQNSRSDFRITVQPPEVYVRKVEVIRARQ